jgi:glycosyltransferase involved in cell wall biosynthesis
LRTRFFRGGRPLRIGAVAPRNGPEGDEGFARLIEAASLLPAARREAFTIELFGEGLDAEHSDLVKAHGLAGRVRLVGAGSPDSLPAAAQDFDVFASTGTLQSPCTFAPLEAGASGCVPILEPSSGLGEWLVHGVHCLKAPDSAAAWARTLTRILDGRIDLAPIGRRIGRAVRTEFHLDRLFPRIEDVLMRAARTPRDGAGTTEEVYRLALLAERLTSVLIQEPYCA